MLDDRGRFTTCAEVLEAWDNGGAVWSIEMGGIGPGYEQAIQVLAMELLRELIAKDFRWTDDSKADSINARALLNPVVSVVDKWPDCGFSGAQVGAAMQIACKFHKMGPTVALDSAPEDRRTMISKNWPHAPALAESFPTPGEEGGSDPASRSRPQK